MFIFLTYHGHCHAFGRTILRNQKIISPISSGMVKTNIFSGLMLLKHICYQLITNKEKSSVSNLSYSSNGSSFEIINFQREEEAYTTFSKIEVG